MVAGSTTKSSEDEFIKCVSSGSEVSQIAGNSPTSGSKLNDQVKATEKSTREVAKGFVLEKIRNGTVRNPSGPSAASSFSANPFSLRSSKAKLSETDTRDLRKLPTFSTGAFEQTLRTERRLDGQLKRAADSAAKAVFAHVERVEIEAMSQRQRELEGGSSSSQSFPPPPGDEDDKVQHEDVNSPVVAESALMFVATVAKIQLTASLTWLQQLTDLRRKCLACEAEQSDAQSPHWQCSEEVQGMLHDCRREFFRELGECREAHRECTKSSEGDDWNDFPDVRTLDRIMKQQAVMIWDPARDNADHRSAGVSCGPLPPWWSLTLSERIFHSLRSADLPTPEKGENCHRDTSDESDYGDYSTESDYGDLQAELNTALTRVSAQHSRALVAEHSLFWSENSREVQKKMILDKKQEAELLEEKYKAATEETTKLHFKMLDLKKQIKQKEDELFQKETALKKALGAASRGALVCKLCGANLEAAEDLPDPSGTPEQTNLLTVPNERSKTPIKKKKKSGGGGGGGFGGGGGGGSGGAGGNADQEPFVSDDGFETFTDEQALEQQQPEQDDLLHMEASLGLESQNAKLNSQNGNVQKGQTSIVSRESAVSSVISFPPNATHPSAVSKYTREDAPTVIENLHSLKQNPPRIHNEISQGSDGSGQEFATAGDDKHRCEAPQIAPVGRLAPLENRAENSRPIGSFGTLSSPVVEGVPDNELRVGIADVWRPASPKSPGNQSTESWQSEASAVVAQLSELRVRVKLNQKRAVATGSAALPLTKCQPEDGQHEREITYEAFDAKYTYEYDDGCKPWQRLYQDARRRVDYLERSAALISARDQEQAASILSVAHEHLQDLKALGLCNQSSSSHLLFDEPEKKTSEKKRMSRGALSASSKESVLPNLMVPRPSSAIRVSNCLQTASMARRRRPPSAAGSRPVSAAGSRMQQQKETLQGRAESVVAIKNRSGQVSIGRAASTGSILTQKKNQSGRTIVAPFAFDTSLPKAEQRPQKRGRPMSAVTRSNSSNTLNFLAQHVARVCGPGATKTTDVDTEPWDFSDLAVRGIEI